MRFNLNEMYLGTFHSICWRWLDDHREFTRLKRNFIMMDQFDQQYFLYRRLNTLSTNGTWRRRTPSTSLPSS